MKKISLWAIILVFTTVAVRAQDAETADRLSKLEGYVQDLQSAQADQKKQIEAMEKEIADLRDKMNQPAANNFVGQDDLNKLAGQVQELAKKQESDNELILKEIEQLGKASGGKITSHAPSPSPTKASATENSNPGEPQNGYYYTVKEKDTLSGIAKWYRSQNIKVTVNEILKANPGLDAKSLMVGKKIFIPQ